MRTIRIKEIGLTVLALITVFGCEKSTFDIVSGQPSQVEIHQNYAYVTNGEGGLQIIDLSNKRTIAQITPSRPAESFDHLSISENFLFLLDARGQGYISVYSISNPSSPKLISGPLPAPVEPFSALSAAQGNVVVSGGTKYLSHRKYDHSGNLSKHESKFGRDRGHPDVVLSSDGLTALVSTDFDGTNFGILSLSLNEFPEAPSFVSELNLSGSGFTGGVTKPSGFPIKSAVKDSILFVTHGGGLSIIELPANKGLSLVSELNIGMEGINIAVWKDTVYAIGIGTVPNLVKIDVSDIRNPQLFDNITLNSEARPTDIAVDKNHILIAANEGGLIYFNH